MPKNCDTTPTVTLRRKRSEHQPRNQSRHPWRSHRTAHRTSQPPGQRVASCRIGNPAGPAGSGDWREWFLFCSCPYYKHGPQRFGGNLVPPCELVGQPTQFVLVSASICWFRFSIISNMFESSILSIRFAPSIMIITVNAIRISFPPKVRDNTL